jgi:acetolactate synthase-1/3 small subunit
MKHTISVLVEDKPGVLARVASLCSRRGFNIHSLAVGPIHETGRSRITLVVDAEQMEQISKQLNKMVNVLKVTELAPEESVEREVMLIRVRADTAHRAEVLAAAAPFEAETVDIDTGSVAFHVTGHPRKLARFLDLMRPYGISDLVKSGRIVLSLNGSLPDATPRRSP